MDADPLTVVAATPVPSFLSRSICSNLSKVLPFSLMLFLASSMTHVEGAVVQVAYRNAKYLWPGFAGTSICMLSFEPLEGWLG